MSAPVMHDLTEMPDLNPTTGSHGLRSVTEGKVWWTDENKVVCHRHRAMNAVNEARTIWRCLQSCGEAAYVEWSR